MNRIIPLPNNELGYEKPSPTGSFPPAADYAISASYAETASFSLGFILSASYSNFSATASYLLGSIANAVSASWSNFSGHALTAETASYAITAKQSTSASYSTTARYWTGTPDSASYSISASYSNYALTASYALSDGGVASVSSSYVSGSSVTVQSISLVSQITASMVSSYVAGVFTATTVDTFSDLIGNSAKWLVSMNDGASFKTSEIITIWNPISNSTNFAEVTTNVLGTVPVALSVNISADQVRLIANPVSGSWTIKTIRFVL